jgi:hypothetical protein
MKTLSIFAALLAVAPAFAGVLEESAKPKIAGRYLEVRSCDVYTGPCFAESEFGSDGKEAILVWSIDKGQWKGTDLSGLNVIAVVKTKDTLGDLKYAEPKGDTVLIFDKKANARQQAALTAFVESAASKLVGKVVNTQQEAIDTTIGTCTKAGTCASVKAGKLVNIATRCICDGDHICGNEYLYYPPLTKIKEATAAYTEVFSFQGRDLGLKWSTGGLRSAYVGSFAH